jgi:pilus assembly protein Flp/PilA
MVRCSSAHAGVALPVHIMAKSGGGLTPMGTLLNERGQSLVEYALILVVVLVVVILALTLVGEDVHSLYTDVVHSVGNLWAQ